MSAYQALLDEAKPLSRERDFVAREALTPPLMVHYADDHFVICEDIDSCELETHTRRVILSGCYADDVFAKRVLVRAPRMLYDLVSGSFPGTVYGVVERWGEGNIINYVRVDSL